MASGDNQDNEESKLSGTSGLIDRQISRLWNESDPKRRIWGCFLMLGFFLGACGILWVKGYSEGKIQLPNSEKAATESSNDASIVEPQQKQEEDIAAEQSTNKSPQDTHSKLKIEGISNEFSARGVSVKIDGFDYLYAGVGTVTSLTVKHSGLADGDELWAYIHSGDDKYYLHRLKISEPQQEDFTYIGKLSLGDQAAPPLKKGEEAEYTLGFVLSQNSNCSKILNEGKTGIESTIVKDNCNDLKGITLTRS